MIQCVYGFDIRSRGGWIVTENMMEKVDLMTKNSRACRLTRLMLAMVVGIFVSMFSFGTVTVQAADTASLQSCFRLSGHLCRQRRSRMNYDLE